MRRIFTLVIAIFLLLPFCSQGASPNEAITRATAAMAAAAPRAQADPWHPIFHVTSPAQWLNDPNGPIFYKGYYHLFYQLNPLSDESGPTTLRYWGHVRSRDLVKWEPLPIALWPSTELNEQSVWSGCCTTNGDGQPMCFYTSIGLGKNAFDQAVQWAAIGDDDLITWQKSPANPVLSETVNGATKIYDWRDPFIFHEGKKTFLIAGGHLKKDGDAAVNIYEAQNSALTEWKYRGALFHVPGAPTAECPNFFKLGNQWVLLLSPYGQVQYFVGDFDATTDRFTARTNGVLDYGSSFYAPNTMQVPDDRRLVWGWVKDFPGGRGWNGCLSLPRQLSFSSAGQLQQNPAPQLTQLRGKKTEQRNLELVGGKVIFALPPTNTLEISVELELTTATNLELQLQSGAKDGPSVGLHFNGSELQALDAKAPLVLTQGKLNLRIFVDRSVLEIFANGTVCITKVIAPLDGNSTLEIHVDGGAAKVKRVQAWPMKSIW